MSTAPDELTRVEERLLTELLVYRDSRFAAGAPVIPPRRSAPSRLRPLRRRNSLEVVLVAAITATIIALPIALLARGDSRTALAATPTPLHYQPLPGDSSARDELLTLASAAARQPAPATPAGRYAYVEFAGWDLTTRVSGGSASSSITSSISESWLAPDGSGRIVSRAFHGDRLHGDLLSGPVVDEFQVSHHPPPRRLSADAGVVARQLAVGHPVQDGPAEQFVAVSDLALDQPIAFPTEAAILRDLATIPTLINSGRVIDRAGRPGVAISLDSSYSGELTRYTLIFDPRTGALLGQEQTLIGNPGGLDVKRGSVISYTTLLASGYVANTAARP